MANILDVALKANVSIATVSRVVNKSDHKVNPATREKVLAAISELDYRPNALAKGLLMKKTMTIGIIIPDISNPYYAEIVRGIQDTADQAGYAVMLHNTDGKQERIIRYIYLLREKSADGVIFCGGIINGYETLSILKELKERVVVVGRHEVDFPAVMVDNMGGATQAVQHLIDLGHRLIGCIAGPDGSTTAADRLTGYRNALAQNGMALNEQLVKRGTWSPESGYLLAKELLEGAKAADGDPVRQRPDGLRGDQSGPGVGPERPEGLGRGGIRQRPPGFLLRSSLDDGRDPDVRYRRCIHADADRPSFRGTVREIEAFQHKASGTGIDRLRRGKKC